MKQLKKKITKKVVPKTNSIPRYINLLIEALIIISLTMWFFGIRSFMLSAVEILVLLVIDLAIIVIFRNISALTSIIALLFSLMIFINVFGISNIGRIVILLIMIYQLLKNLRFI